MQDTEEGIPLDQIPLHSTNLLTVLDESGIIQYESPSIERLYGFEQAELVGDQVADYFHPDDRENVVAAFRTVVESEAYREEAIEYRHETGDGSYLWVESVASANPTPEGHYVINTRDVSERRAREQELHRANDRLDEFASVVSHDLRNPLNVATSRLEIATEECDSEHLDHAMTAVKRGPQLIEDIQALTTVGGDDLQKEPIRLETAVNRSWRTVPTKNATITLEGDRTIHTNPGRIQQLLENLFTNAVEHGGESVVVTVDTMPDGFYVEDDGAGIHGEERTDVFDIGYTTKAAGTGFGLGIVKEIVEDQDWDITVDESETGGTRFAITGMDADA
jgi:PAS domain S-box-containing protein